ncbi:MAG: SIMPL domain-containing protein [Candidatus Gastranaerophilales bacterium]|nr:SIMPL domain-containing protein [Candidatus Gastranaerophilales bacterium]
MKIPMKSTNNKVKKLVYFLLICMCFLLINENSNASSGSEVKKDAGFISLNTTTVKEVEPDFASVIFTVENMSDSAKKASEENKKIANAVINAIKSVISEQTDTIKTTNFLVIPVYSTSQGKKTIKNYKASNSITVETRDISKITNIIDTAITNGANRTNSLVYSLQNEKSYCSELYPELLKDLKKQAAALAAAAGTSLDGVKHVNASCTLNSSNGRITFLSKPNLSDAADAISDETTTPLEAGNVKIRIYISADFYVK